jgi:lactate dehydrogenase-like 2-hydroxyacid dehydrogenase
MRKVLITDYVTNKDIENTVFKKTDYEVVTFNENFDKSQVEAILVWHEIINSKFLDDYPNLKFIQRYGVGCDNIDFDQVKVRNLILCNTPDYGVDEVSDTTVGMILGLTRSIYRYDIKSKTIDDGTWQENIFKETRRSSEIRVGILGAGRIGGSVILKCKHLGFQTSFYDPFLIRGMDKTYGSYRFDSIDDFISKNDVISINATQTETSFHLVNEEFISKMKQGSYLINTARGKIIKDLDAFIDPIKEEKILGLGLDVLPDEPPKKSKLIESWRKSEPWLQNRVIINPHAGYYSKSSWLEMRVKSAENVLRFLNSGEYFNVVCKS